ncbi:MAG TPA: CPBP family intramembrane glutamic endopeptidase [Thermohalobaculum sp.]|nr:CPBP family intramembrane glutamic endopeptidase [Thermohalobaculum sp.]
MQRAVATSQTLPRPRLWAEFAVLFVAAPLAMVLFFGLYSLFAALLAVTILSLVLLARTPGFVPGELVRGPVLGHWPLILGFTLGSATVAVALALMLVPERAFDLPRHQTGLWLRIMLLYPLLSALPQELIFRALFFRRYGPLFPDGRVALAVNAAAFSGAHLFYQNPVAIGLTLLGGVVFAWTYQRTGSFLLVVILHAIGGQIVFTSGLGIYFYHGAIGHAP